MRPGRAAAGNAARAPQRPRYAYVGRDGTVSVIIHGEPIPADSTLLADGTSRHPTLIELKASLNAIGEGLSADCLTTAQAQRPRRGSFVDLDRADLRSDPR